MKYRIWTLYDGYGNEIAFMESETPIEDLIRMRWAFNHAIRNSTETFRTPIFEENPIPQKSLYLVPNENPETQVH